MASGSTSYSDFSTLRSRSQNWMIQRNSTTAASCFLSNRDVRLRPRCPGKYVGASSTHFPNANSASATWPNAIWVRPSSYQAWACVGLAATTLRKIGTASAGRSDTEKMNASTKVASTLSGSDLRIRRHSVSASSYRLALTKSSARLWRKSTLVGSNSTARRSRRGIPRLGRNGRERRPSGLESRGFPAAGPARCENKLPLLRISCRGRRHRPLPS